MKSETKMRVVSQDIRCLRHAVIERNDRDLEDLCRMFPALPFYDKPEAYFFRTPSRFHWAFNPVEVFEVPALIILSSLYTSHILA